MISTIQTWLTGETPNIYFRKGTLNACGFSKEEKGRATIYRNEYTGETSFKDPHTPLVECVDAHISRTVRYIFNGILIGEAFFTTASLLGCPSGNFQPGVLIGSILGIIKARIDCAFKVHPLIFCVRSSVFIKIEQEREEIRSTLADRTVKEIEEYNRRMSDVFSKIFSVICSRKHIAPVCKRMLVSEILELNIFYLLDVHQPTLSNQRERLNKIKSLFKKNLILFNSISDRGIFVKKPYTFRLTSRKTNTNQRKNIYSGIKIIVVSAIGMIIGMIFGIAIRILILSELIYLNIIGIGCLTYFASRYFPIENPVRTIFKSQN